MRTGRPKLDREGIKRRILSFLNGRQATCKDIVSAVRLNKGSKRSNNIEYLIKELKENGKIEYVGRNKSGAMLWTNLNSDEELTSNEITTLLGFILHDKLINYVDYKRDLDSSYQTPTYNELERKLEIMLQKRVRLEPQN